MQNTDRNNKFDEIVLLITTIKCVIIETIWCFIRFKKIESRKGLIYGPFNPLYGVAAMALSFCINNMSDKSMGEIFLIGVVLGSVIEYACSYYQEKVLGTISWDYKDFKFNLKGRINLVYSIFWGVLTIFWGEVCMPTLNSYVPLLVEHIVFTNIFFVLMLADCLISLYAGIRRLQRRKNIEAQTKMQKHFDSKYNDEIMDKIYPNSKFTEKGND